VGVERAVCYPTGRRSVRPGNRGPLIAGRQGRACEQE
jgi:hypothetical protein